MRQSNPIQHVSLALCFAGCLIFSLAYADDVRPWGYSNAVTKYCNNGVCSTNSTAPSFNETVGQYPIGQYPGGTHINQVLPIGILLSKTCIDLEMKNITSHCLTYKQLMVFDNTNQAYSGKLTPYPYWHRLPALVPNASIFENKSLPVMVDPTAQFLERAKVITVNQDNFTFTNPDDVSYRGLILVSHVNRSVTNCAEALVAPILPLINDTIHYLQSDCVNSNFNDTKNTYQKDIPFTFSNPYSTLHYEKLTQTLEKTGGMKDCIHHKCSYSDPYANPAYSFGRH